MTAHQALDQLLDEGHVVVPTDDSGKHKKVVDGWNGTIANKVVAVTWQ